MLDYKNPKLIIETAKVEAGSISWRSPSNLAIIKYWGKFGQQRPRNPSISLTLENAFTETRLEYAPRKTVDDGNVQLNFFFDGQANEAFRAKVLNFLNSITDIFPFLKQLELTIKSSNSFPHSSGIASSASSMSALAMCLCSLEKHFFNSLEKEEDFLQKASFIARLGSGSASRSVYPLMAMWGNFSDIEKTSDFYAIPYQEKIHEVFKTYHDDILIINKGEKSVSSRAGHGLMENNIYADNRYQQANIRMRRLLASLESGDLETFGKIAEDEALTLHALMMMSTPSYLLIKPNTLKAIELVRDYRRQTKQALYFSLDAGPNLHLLYPANIKSEVQHFIQNELSQYCEKGEWIADYVGAGPKQV